MVSDHAAQARKLVTPEKNKATVIWRLTTRPKRANLSLQRCAARVLGGHIPTAAGCSGAHILDELHRRRLARNQAERITRSVDGHDAGRGVVRTIDFRGTMCIFWRGRHVALKPADVTGIPEGEGVGCGGDKGEGGVEGGC